METTHISLSNTNSAPKKGISRRTFALLTGWSLVLMAITGGFSLGFAFPAFFSPEEGATVTGTFLQKQGLYGYMLIGIGVTLILDLIVSWTIFKYFAEDGRKLALASGGLRLVYTLIFAIATMFLLANLLLDQPSELDLMANYSMFQTIWWSGLILFGVHLVLTGWLMRLHRRIPAALWITTIVAGFSYVLVDSLSLLPVEPAIVESVQMALTLPMIVGEIGLAIWLLVKGGKKV